MKKRKEAVSGPGKEGDGPPSPASVISWSLHRFPWPAKPAQRFCLASPWLAVVNARGPWGVWQHLRREPAWLPLYDSLWRKPWFAGATPAVQMGVINVWRMMAKANYWGVEWGEPTRLCFQWGIDPETLNATLSVMLEVGALVYLTHAEKLAMESWKPGGRKPGDGQRQIRDGLGEREGTKGGTIGGDSRGEYGVQVSDRDSREKTGTVTGTGDRRQPTGKHARALLSGSRDCQREPATGTDDSDSRQGQGHPQGQAQGTGHRDSPTEPANLPDSDQGSDNRGAVRNRRSPSALADDAGRLGDYLHWSDPLAMDFARRMFRAVLGREAPADATTASRSDRSVLGAWASAWVKKFSHSLNPGQFEAFCERAERDVAKKRGKAGVRNLGAVAMDKIVPGIVRSLAKEKS